MADDAPEQQQVPPAAEAPPAEEEAPAAPAEAAPEPPASDAAAPAEAGAEAAGDGGDAEAAVAQAAAIAASLVDQVRGEAVGWVAGGCGPARDSRRLRHRVAAAARELAADRSIDGSGREGAALAAPISS